MGQHIDFLIVDREILSDALLPAAMRKLPLIVPPMDCPEKELEKALAAHEARGGTVRRIEAGTNEENIAALIASLAAPRLGFHAAEPTDRLWMVTRQDDRGRRLWFFLNTSDTEIDLELDPKVALEEVPLGEPGLVRLVGHKRKVTAFESFLLAEGAKPAVATPAEVEIAVPRRAAFRIHNDNLLRIDRWELYLADAPEYMRTVASRPIINQLAEGEFPIRPAIETHFGWASELSVGRMRACYASEFDCAYEGVVRLVMEPGSLRGDWTIRVNDGAPLAAGDFVESSAHVRGSLEHDITALLQLGVNRLEVTIEISRVDDGLVNPLYLAGSFGVFAGSRPEVPRIAKLPSEGPFEGYEENGLPFFSGTLEYRFAAAMHLPERPSGNLLSSAAGYSPCPSRRRLRSASTAGHALRCPGSPTRRSRRPPTCGRARTTSPCSSTPA